MPESNSGFAGERRRFFGLNSLQDDFAGERGRQRLNVFDDLAVRGIGFAGGPEMLTDLEVRRASWDSVRTRVSASKPTACFGCSIHTIGWNCVASRPPPRISSMDGRMVNMLSPSFSG